MPGRRPEPRRLADGVEDRPRDQEPAVLGAVDERLPVQLGQGEAGIRTERGLHGRFGPRLGQDREDLQHLQGEPVELVERALDRRPGGRPGGQRRDVGRDRGEQVGPGAQQRRQGVVVTGAQLRRQRREAT